MSAPPCGLVLGIDVGFSAARRSTGIAVLKWTEEVIFLQVENVRRVELPASIDRLVPRERQVLCAGLDGPFRRSLDIIDAHRTAEKVLTRALGQHIGKPGAANAPVGRRLNQATNEIAAHLRDTGRLAPAGHEARIHDLALVEAFPTHFLGVLLDEKERRLPEVHRGNRSDRFYEHLHGRLEDLLCQLLPGRTLLQGLSTVRNHDQRAAVVCALTALCVVSGQYVAVGDAGNGFMMLPPPATPDRMGAQAWSVEAVCRCAQRVAREEGCSWRELVVLEPSRSLAEAFQVEPAGEVAAVRELFREYQVALGVDLSFQGFSEELAALPEEYAPPRGLLLVARCGNELAGCIALRPMEDGRCEMKRLYLRSMYRGLGLGRRLAEAVIGGAGRLGYRQICLDTLPSMGEAQALYRSLGFEEIPAYRFNPVPGTTYFGLEPPVGRAQEG